MEEKKDSLSACGSCTAHSGEKKSVPYIVHESTMARMERQLKRSWILCILMFLAFAVSNVAWIYYENQFEDVIETQMITQDVDSGNGGDATINDGVYVNGEGKTNSKDNKKNPP